jgi:hypothetical protein
MHYRSRLGHYVTIRKVAGLIPKEVMGFIFNLPNSSSRTITLEFIHPLK